MSVYHDHRLGELEDTVNPAWLKKVWKETVRPGMRNQPLPDLHDFLDIHWDLDNFLNNLREDVLAGVYRPRHPDIARLEKGKGLFRLLLVPMPSEALLLQSMTSRWEGKILAKRPSKNAFYSRSHARPEIEQLSSKVTYPWWVKWRQFTEQIYSFKKVFPFVVVTDISNYFDNIDTATLRKRISSRVKVNEAELDLLFFILDSLQAKPFYGCNSHIGIPQINFDAPRLLATAYLFEADSLLQKRSKGNFVRWMDDIDFGAKSESDAMRILGELDLFLQGLNVRINSGKTKILNKKQAEEHFWITDNIRLNKLSERLDKLKGKTHTKKYKKYVASLRKAISAFKRSISSEKNRIGVWDKVFMRYVGLASKCGISDFEVLAREYAIKHPSIRRRLVEYLRILGYSPGRITTYRLLFKSVYASDPCLLCDIAEAISSWDIKLTSNNTRRLWRFASQLERAIIKIGVVAFVAGLMLHVKFSSPGTIYAYIHRNTSTWRHSVWGLRQVSACLPALDAPHRISVAEEIVKSGSPDAIRVIVSLRNLRHKTSLAGDRSLKGYAEWKDKPSFGYNISRFLVNIQLLSGSLDVTEKQSLYNHLSSQVKDEYIMQKFRTCGLSNGLST